MVLFRCGIVRISQPERNAEAAAGSIRITAGLSYKSLKRMGYVYTAKGTISKSASGGFQGIKEGEQGLRDSALFWP